LVAETGTTAVKLRSAVTAARKGSSFSFSAILSTLFTTRITGRSSGSSLSTALSLASKRPASTTNSTTSTSARVWVTPRFMARLRALVCSVWKPGVSTKTNWASSLVRMPVMRWRVVWALRETMEIFSPTRRLSRVDLPTLGRPTMAT